MREAYSGIVNIFFIAVFLVIVSGILAFIVTYTKAFKMKNIVISTVEQYEGSGCKSDSSSCFARIEERAKNIHLIILKLVVYIVLESLLVLLQKM